MKDDSAREKSMSVVMNGRNMMPLVPVTPNAVATTADKIAEIISGMMDMAMFTVEYTKGSIPARNI